MDHSCYKCGHPVGEGKPFCAECGAPQIRVAMPEPPPMAGSRDIPPEAAPPFLMHSSGGSSTDSSFTARVDWRRALMPSIAAAAIAIVVMLLRLVFPLVGTAGAGVLAVLFFRRRNPLWTATARSAAQLGGAAGLVISVFFAFIFAIFMAILQAGGPARQQLLDSLQEIGSRSNDQQALAVLEMLKNPDGLALKLAVGMVGFLLISVAVGSLAGALTGVLLGRKKRP